MIKKADKNALRQKRHLRIRKAIKGTLKCPRLNVYRSISHIYGQLIDDKAGKTLVFANTMEKEIADKLSGKNKVEQAAIIGETIGKRAMEKGYKKIVFDRGGYLYTGRVAAFADGARKAGLDF